MFERSNDKFATNRSNIFGYYANCEWRICQVYNDEIKTYPNSIICWVFNFKTCKMSLLIKSIIAAHIFRLSDAVNFHVKLLWMQYSVIIASESCRTEIIKSMIAAIR